MSDSQRSRTPIAGETHGRTTVSADGKGVVQTVVMWILRGCWAIIGALGWGLIERFAQDRSQASVAMVIAIAAAVWLVGVAGLAITSPIGLTATRLTIPIGVIVAVIALVAEPGPEALVFAITAVIATSGALSGEFANRCVQASAYGDEYRFSLRPPAGYLVASVAAWLLWAAALTAAVWWIVLQRWWLGLAAAAMFAFITAAAVPRWHLLSQRWLVMVPAGLVVVDRLMLAETIMYKRSQIRSLALADSTTTAVDLTGPAAGHAIEIDTHEPLIVIAAPKRRGSAPTPLSTPAILVAPSRPGAALERARRQRLSVGSQR